MQADRGAHHAATHYGPDRSTHHCNAQCSTINDAVRGPHCYAELDPRTQQPCRGLWCRGGSDCIRGDFAPDLGLILTRVICFRRARRVMCARLLSPTGWRVQSAPWLPPPPRFRPRTTV